MTDWMLGSIVFLGRLEGWLLVIGGYTEWFVGGVWVLRCEVGRGGLKMFASSNPTVVWELGCLGGVGLERMGCEV